MTELLMTDEVKRRFLSVDEYAFLRVAADQLWPRRVLLGELIVRDFEVMTDSHQCGRVITAKIWALFEEVGEQLRAPTLPVHDEPMPEELLCRA